MPISDQEDQAERRRVLRNDERVREQSRNGDTGTFLSHSHIDDVGGRFAHVNSARVVGASGDIAAQYPAASAAHQTELPNEQPLGYRVDAMLELETSASPIVEATDDPAVAPLSDDGPATFSGGSVSEPAGSSLSPQTMVARRKSQITPTGAMAAGVRAGRPPARARRRSK